MKVLWTHTFNVNLNKNAGVFMFNSAKQLKKIGIDLSLEYLGDLRSPVKIYKAINYINKVAIMSFFLIIVNLEKNF